jgi:hypothetical protein
MEKMGEIGEMGEVGVWSEKLTLPDGRQASLPK